MPVFILLWGELKYTNLTPGRPISHEAVVHHLLLESPSEAPVAFVVVTDVDSANVGERLFPYGACFNHRALCSVSRNQLPFQGLPNSSIQCKTVRQL